MSICVLCVVYVDLTVVKARETANRINCKKHLARLCW